MELEAAQQQPLPPGASQPPRDLPKAKAVTFLLDAYVLGSKRFLVNECVILETVLHGASRKGVCVAWSEQAVKTGRWYPDPPPHSLWRQPDHVQAAATEEPAGCRVLRESKPPALRRSRAPLVSGKVL